MAASAEPTERTVGERIRDGRHAAGLSQQGLAQALGVYVSTVSRWELDLGAPDLKNRRQLAELLGGTSTDYAQV